MKYRVLVYGMSSNPGGIESFLMNYIKKANLKKVEFDFLNIQNTPLAYSKEIKEMGNQIINLRLVDGKHHHFKYRQQVDRFFKENAANYDCIWFNLVSLSSLLWIRKAKKYQIPKIIVHAHNSAIMTPGLSGLKNLALHNLNKKNIKYYATDLWACSSLSGKWFFGKNKFRIINNAISINDFKFNKEKRKKIRKKLNISDDMFVLGNVGRLQYQKNQQFAIRVLKKYLTYNQNVRLIFVGDGDDSVYLKEMVEKEKLINYVYFVGKQDDIQAWLSAFDLFLFPSRFEGFPIAGLEAEANGLPILAAGDGIPKELKLNDNLEFLYLKDSVDLWCKKIDSLSRNKRINPLKIKKEFMNKNYDLDSVHKNWGEISNLK